MYPVKLLDNLQGNCEWETSFGPLFLESFPHDGQFRLSLDRTFNLVLENIELLATSF